MKQIVDDGVRMFHNMSDEMKLRNKLYQRLPMGAVTNEIVLEQWEKDEDGVWHDMTAIVIARQNVAMAQKEAEDAEKIARKAAKKAIRDTYSTRNQVMLAQQKYDNAQELLRDSCVCCHNCESDNVMINDDDILEYQFVCCDCGHKFNEE